MAWFIVRTSSDKHFPGETNRYYLKVGDIIKFGRVRFKIRKLVLEQEEGRPEPANNSPNASAIRMPELHQRFPS